MISDKEIKEELRFGLSLSKKIMRSKGFFTLDMDEVESMINETCTVCLGRFEPEFGLAFHDFFVMNVFYNTYRHIENTIGRSQKQRDRANAQHVVFESMFLCCIWYENPDSVYTLNEKTFFLKDLARRLNGEEKKVLDYIYKGYSNEEIGNMLGVGESQTARIKRKVIEHAKKLVGNNGTDKKCSFTEDSDNCRDESRFQHPPD